MNEEMKSKILAYSCQCANCGRTMNKGDEFQWKTVYEKTGGHRMVSSSVLPDKVRKFRPVHTFNCQVSDKKLVPLYPAPEMRWDFGQVGE